MRFLCISDIHGDDRALEAVLEEAKFRGFDQLVVCGDLLFPGPGALPVWKMLLEHHALCVQGVADRAVAEVDPRKLTATSPVERERIERLRQLHTELGDLIIVRLGKLPKLAHLPLESGHTMLVCHGSPADPTEPLTEEMSDDDVLSLLGDEAGDVIVCGASHSPFQRQVADVHIVNVGSVGQAPGGGHAHATLLESGPLGFQVQQFVVDLPE